MIADAVEVELDTAVVGKDESCEQHVGFIHMFEVAMNCTYICTGFKLDGQKQMVSRRHPRHHQF